MSYVAEILLKHDLVPADKLEELAASADERGVALLDVVRVTGIVEEKHLIRALAAALGLDVIDSIDVDRVPEALIDLVPITFARQQHILPIGEREATVIAAVGNPLDVQAVDEIDLDASYRARDLIDLLRARTFPPHEGAFFRTEGRRVNVRIQLEYGRDADDS